MARINCDNCETEFVKNTWGLGDVLLCPQCEVEP